MYTCTLRMCLSSKMTSHYAHATKLSGQFFSGLWRIETRSVSFMLDSSRMIISCYDLLSVFIALCLCKLTLEAMLTLVWLLSSVIFKILIHDYPRMGHNTFYSCHYSLNMKRTKTLCSQLFGKICQCFNRCSSHPQGLHVDSNWEWYHFVLTKQVIK